MKVVMSLLVSSSLKSFSTLPLVRSLRPILSIARLGNSRTLTDCGYTTPFSSYGGIFHGITPSVSDYAPSSSRIGQTNTAQVTSTSRAGNLSQIVASLAGGLMGLKGRTSLSSGSSPDDNPSPKPIEFVWVQLYIDKAPVGSQRAWHDTYCVASIVKKECSKLLEDIDTPLLQFYAHDDNEFKTQLGPEVTLATEVHGGDSLERAIIVNGDMPKGMSN
jgi:hypothetical protein